MTLTLARKRASDPPTLDTACQRFVTRCEGMRLSRNTIAYYGYHLLAFRRFIGTLPHAPALADIDKDLLRKFIASRAKVSDTTAHHSMLTMKVFCKFCHEEGLLPANPAEGLAKVRRRKPIIPTFTEAQIRALFETCAAGAFTDVRDRAIILLLLDTGLRASELCSLTLDALDTAERVAVVWGKGDKQRRVPYGEAAATTLTTYLDRRGELDTDQLFVSSVGEPFSVRGLQDMLKARAKTASLKGVRCSPHTFRHTFAVSFLRRGGNVFALQRILGHTDLAMTRRYSELAESDVTDQHRAYSPGDAYLDAVKVKTTKRRIR